MAGRESRAASQRLFDADPGLDGSTESPGVRGGSAGGPQNPAGGPAGLVDGLPVRVQCHVHGSALPGRRPGWPSGGPGGLDGGAVALAVPLAVPSAGNLGQRAGRAAGLAASDGRQEHPRAARIMQAVNGYLAGRHGRKSRILGVKQGAKASKTQRAGAEMGLFPNDSAECSSPQRVTWPPADGQAGETPGGTGQGQAVSAGGRATGGTGQREAQGGVNPPSPRPVES